MLFEHIGPIKDAIYYKDCQLPKKLEIKKRHTTTFVPAIKSAVKTTRSVVISTRSVGTKRRYLINSYFQNFMWGDTGVDYLCNI